MKRRTFVKSSLAATAAIPASLSSLEGKSFSDAQPAPKFAMKSGLFLTKISQSYMICKAVDSPACKTLFDIYHQQIQEGNLIPNMEAAWEEIGYFQIGDNPGRREPTTGEINYKNIFKYIHEKGYQGILGMEHKNFSEGIRLIGR